MVCTFLAIGRPIVSDHLDFWDELVLSLLSWSIENFKISMNNVEDVHHLSLILMNSLHLDIIHGVDWDVITGLLLNPFSKSVLVLDLDLDELVNEGLVGSIWHKELQVVESGDPLIDTTEGVTDQLRKFWVAAVDPSSWGNTVGLVLELSWVELVKFLEKGSL